MPSRVLKHVVCVLTRPIGAARSLLFAGLAVVLASCSLPMEQLSLPQPIGGGQPTGSIGRPNGTPLGPPGTVAAGQPQVYPGQANYVRPGETADPGIGGGAQLAPGTGRDNAAPSANGSRSVGVETGDGVSLDLAGATIPEAAATVFNDLMRVPYTVSDRVKGTVTLQTVKPVSRDALLELFETVLTTNDAALIVDNGVYRIVTRDEALAAGQPAKPRIAGQLRGPGVGTEVVPLKYVSAAEMERILKSVAPKSMVARADTSRNLLILTGTRSELESMTETVRVFDVDWMRGMSFGIFPIETSDVEAIAKELDTIFANDSDSPSKGMARFVPNKRLKAILVITSRPEYLKKAEIWLQRIDLAAEATQRRAYVYQVQYRPVQELVTILQRLYPAPGPRRESAPAAGVASAVASPVNGANPSTPTGSITLPVRSGGGVAPPLDAPAEVVTLGTPPASAPVANEPALAATADAAADPLAAGAANGVTTGSVSQSVPDDRDSGISFVADDGNNAIVVSATPGEWRRIRQVLSEVDLMPPQVLIEATIAEVTLTDDLKFGLRWFFEKGGSEFRLTDTLAGAALGSIAPQFPGFAYFLNTTNAKVALNALADITNVNVVSSPSLMVLNNKKAVLQIGDQVPIATQQAVASDEVLAPIVNAISFRETGVLLTIIPRVADDGRILLDIEQEVSDAKATTTSDIDSPTIAQRRIKTTVTVSNGGSVVLAGLMQDRATRQRQQVPLAGDIPLIGNLFKNKDDEIARTELMIAITPHIVNDERQTGAIAAEFRDRLNFNTRPQRETLPEHREQFDRLAR
ncbi:MAG: type II secretion system protein GspD [Hyphomicrobium sp. 32-62-53]|nr:MAG: type II secretion system protein GspD [Hyphomicrobium sp. 12-62-95]OYY00190.1 MAG: type II secretion system protein GspD [Hyphomicrobium sp. 32-62-53]